MLVKSDEQNGITYYENVNPTTSNPGLSDKVHKVLREANGTVIVMVNRLQNAGDIEQGVRTQIMDALRASGIRANRDRTGNVAVFESDPEAVSQALALKGLLSAEVAQEIAGLESKRSSEADTRIIRR